MNLLHIDSSILAANSASRELSAAIAGRLRQRHEGLDVTYCDLAVDPLAHFSALHVASAQGFAPETDATAADIEQGRAALDEFLAADIVVVGAPMYNFGIPTQLKAWIDRIAVAGKTFRYTEQGPEGLAGGKTVFIASSRGGFYGPDTSASALEHQESHLTGVFTFVGITDIRIVRAEGLNLGPDQRQAALNQALAGIVETVDRDLTGQ